MATNDTELIQSFVRRYVNKEVKEHFKDVAGDSDSSLSVAVTRTLIKRICLHKDDDSLILTTLRLLIYWVEARGLFNDIIYGIPSTEFEIYNTYYPQVKLHFKEDKYEAANNIRRPARSEVSFRWRQEDYSTVNINQLTNKIVADFVNPVFFYNKGREAWTYWDKSKGYRFTVYVQDEQDAKKIIEQSINIQDEGEPDWDKNLREHIDKKNYSLQETVRVMGETIKKPKKRPVAKVEFQYAELFIPGTTKPLILVDRTGTKSGALRYA